MSPINLIVTFITLIIYLALLPAINTAIDIAVAQLEENPNDFTSVIVIILHMMPFFIALMIILTGLHYAIPRREGIGG